MKLLFVHGWSYDATVWDGVVEQLPASLETRRLDFGYTGLPVDLDFFASERFVLVGHSLGVAWSLAHGVQPAGLLSIAGFDHFSAHVPRSALRAMRRNLQRDPAGQVKAFRDNCDCPQEPVGKLNQDRLVEGLDLLGSLDARAALARLDCPVRALAARDDKIVPESMSQAIWGDHDLVWSENGGHALPLTRPDWCAAQILEMVDAVA